MNRFIILMSSNWEAEKNIQSARKVLTSAFLEDCCFSENHWTVAVVTEGQPKPVKECAYYLNAVCRAQSMHDLEQIQVFLKQTEVDFGRLRGAEAKGHVSLDLDLVEWNGKILRPKDAAQDYYTLCLMDLTV